MAGTKYLKKLLRNYSNHLNSSEEINISESKSRILNSILSKNARSKSIWTFLMKAGFLAIFVFASLFSLIQIPLSKYNAKRDGGFLDKQISMIDQDSNDIPEDQLIFELSKYDLNFE